MEGKVIHNLNEIGNRLNFTFKNTDVSIVNGLRRTILSNIDTIVFRGFPHSENQIDITTNKTKFNNEYLKHRLSCVPVMNSDSSTFESFCNLYQIKIQEENTTLEKKYVTTEHIQIVSKKDGTPIKKEETMKYFPRDPITQEYILLCVLYPNFNASQSENESIELTANFNIGTAEESSCWNVVHHCAYEALQDEAKVEELAQQIQDPMKKKDFQLLDAQRHVVPDAFVMSVETLGIYSNKAIVQKACEYIISQLSLMEMYFNPKGKVQTIMTKDEYLDASKDGTLSKETHQMLNESYCFVYKEEQFYVLELKRDDYTMGKIIENHYFKQYESYVSYVGFKKEHPTKKEAYIYIKYKKQENSAQLLYVHFNELIQKLLVLFRNIQKEFM